MTIGEAQLVGRRASVVLPLAGELDVAGADAAVKRMLALDGRLDFVDRL